MQIPTLTFDRFTLRPLHESDVPALVRLHSDPEVMRYLRPDGTVETTPRQAWEYIAIHAGHWHLKGCGKWALVDSATDQLIGRVGYYDPPYEWPGLELGWTLLREHWGKGYATTAAREAMRWGFEVRGFNEIISAIHPDNAASIRVAERLGEQRLRMDTVYGNPCLIYGMTDAQWCGLAGT